MTLAATFHSPNYAPPNYDFDTIELFTSLEECIEALFDRYSSNGQRECEAVFLDGHSTSTLYPNVEAGASFTCYLLRESADPENPEEWEGVVLEAHTAVHGGWRDYTVTLVESEQGSLVCMVERAGI
jgi:hypothetical protein